MTNAVVNLGQTVSSITSGLLTRAQERDHAAWERLVHIFGPLVYDWCRHHGLQPSDAENVGQDVFLAVSRNLHRFRHDERRHSFTRWLRTITTNKIRDFWRTRAKEPPGEGGSDAQLALQRLENGANEAEECLPTYDESRFVYSRLIECVRRDFEEITWKAFYLVAVEEQKVPDVAAELGISPNAVYLAKSRVLRRLRESLLPMKE